MSGSRADGPEPAPEDVARLHALQAVVEWAEGRRRSWLAAARGPQVAGGAAPTDEQARYARAMAQAFAEQAEAARMVMADRPVPGQGVTAGRVRGFGRHGTAGNRPGPSAGFPGRSGGGSR